MTQEFHYGYDPETREFVLWKRGRKLPVARIPFDDAVSMCRTVTHVQYVDLQRTIKESE